MTARLASTRPGTSRTRVLGALAALGLAFGATLTPAQAGVQRSAPSAPAGYAAALAIAPASDVVQVHYRKRRHYHRKGRYYPRRFLRRFGYYHTPHRYKRHRRWHQRWDRRRDRHRRRSHRRYY